MNQVAAELLRCLQRRHSPAVGGKDSSSDARGSGVEERLSYSNPKEMLVTLSPWFCLLGDKQCGPADCGRLNSLKYHQFLAVFSICCSSTRCKPAYEGKNNQPNNIKRALCTCGAGMALCPPL